MKAAGIIVNFFFPGIGSFIVGKAGQGTAQLLLYILGVLLTFTGILAIFGIPLCVAVWIWGLVTAANSPSEPVKITLVHENSGFGLLSQASAVGTALPPPSFDVNKWNALVQFDEDIRAAADRIKPLGQKWEARFAAAYLALNDKNYISTILQKITAEARQEAEALRSMPKMIDSGVHKGRQWRRFDNGVVEADAPAGLKSFKSIEDMRAYFG